jgi:uncharacterized protein YraI
VTELLTRPKNATIRILSKPTAVCPLARKAHYAETVSWKAPRYVTTVTVSIPTLVETTAHRHTAGIPLSTPVKNATMAVIQTTTIALGIASKRFVEIPESTIMSNATTGI